MLKSLLHSLLAAVAGRLGIRAALLAAAFLASLGFHQLAWANQGVLVFSLEGIATADEDPTDEDPAEEGYYKVGVPGGMESESRAFNDQVEERLKAGGELWVRISGDGENLNLKRLGRDRRPFLVFEGCGEPARIRPNGASIGLQGVWIYRIGRDADAEDETAYRDEHGECDGFRNVQSPGFRIKWPGYLSIKPGEGRVLAGAWESRSTSEAAQEHERLQEIVGGIPATRTERSLAVTISQGERAISDAGEEFEKFSGSRPNSATLGAVALGLAPGAENHFMPNGEQVSSASLGGLLGDASKVAISSTRGFGFAKFTLGGQELNAVPNSEGAELSSTACGTLDANALDNECEASAVAGVQNLKVEAADPPQEILSASFKATVKFDYSGAQEDVRRLLPEESGPKPVGEIRHSGSTFHIPFITTFEGYNNRIFIVNRSTRGAKYFMSFTAEGGVSVTAKDGMSVKQQGDVGAQSTTVIRILDLVDIEGGSRASATIVVDAPPQDIDVMSQVVNKSDGSLSTVNYESEQARGL